MFNGSASSDGALAAPALATKSHSRPIKPVATSDSDDGRHQKRLLATSDLAYGKWWTFGEVPPEQDGASCVVSKGVLEPRHQPLALPD